MSQFRWGSWACLPAFGLLAVFVSLLSDGSKLMAGSFKSEVYQDTHGAKLNYRIYVPDSASSAAKLPLVLFLHGAGERGDDNEAQLKHGAMEFIQVERAERFPAIIVAPQCPEEQRWVDKDWGEEPGIGRFPEEPSAAMTLVFALLDELVQRTDVDTTRLYVTGLSMGGYGSWYAAAKYRVPHSVSAVEGSGDGFAAMLAVCGGCDPSWADRYAATDLWAVHGDADTVVPVGHSREMVAAIASHGHPGELRYTEMPGVQHDSWTATYASESTYKWLFDQTR